ncbi:MAG: hypothetical protein JJU29_14585 [Verrucomicrobia bacterium]|nr:hypothetical protein [Verrucomicrobiota bacterium]MCH8512774.1 hypothetical protein [Kiritimatiellia bacterium]
MKIETFFNHWKLRENPFTAEEARDDDVYARIMSDGVAHPEFEKIFGRPERPSTSVVFGEKGSGKTALRLLMEQRLKEYNDKNPRKKTWIVRYDEWNHMVDRAVGAENADDPENFKRIRLEDHIDKLISMVVTELIDAASRPKSSKVAKELGKNLRKMPRQHRLDLAYLAVLYDQPSLSTRNERWQKISKILHVNQLVTPSFLLYLFGGGAMVTFLSLVDVLQLQAGMPYTLITAILGGGATFVGGYFGLGQFMKNRKRRKMIQSELKVVDHPTSTLTKQLGNLKASELDALPLPTPGDQDCRYELLGRLQRILKGLDFMSLTVLVDRVDEPSLVNGDAKKMRNLIWPLFSHKMLQHDGMGIKMLLPIELGYELKREDGDFFSRARLDKGNLIERLEWTGVNLYDICNQRVQAVCDDAENPTLLKDLFEERVSVQDLVDSLDQMKQPRDAFKFLYEVIIQHCKGSTDADPEFLIPKLTLDQSRRHQAQRVSDLARGFSAA